MIKLSSKISWTLIHIVPGIDLRIFYAQLDLTSPQPHVTDVEPETQRDWVAYPVSAIPSCSSSRQFRQGRNTAGSYQRYPLWQQHATGVGGPLEGSHSCPGQWLSNCSPELWGEPQGQGWRGGLCAGAHSIALHSTLPILTYILALGECCHIESPWLEKSGKEVEDARKVQRCFQGQDHRRWG